MTSPGAGGKVKRIVVGVDGSEHAERALAWAAEQAQRTGAALEIHTAYEPGYAFTTSEEVEMAMRRVLEQATEAVAKAAPEVATTTMSHQEAPAAALIEASEGAELLVVGSRGLGGFRGLLLGSIGLQCSQHAHCPVVIVR